MTSQIKLGLLALAVLFAYVAWQIKSQNFESYSQDQVNINGNSVIAANDAYLAKMEKNRKASEGRNSQEFTAFFNSFIERKLSPAELKQKVDKFIAQEYLDEGFIAKMFELSSRRNCSAEYIQVLSKYKMHPNFHGIGALYLSQNAIPDKKECAEALITCGMYNTPEDIQKLRARYP